MAQRQRFASGVALAFVACGGHVRTNEASPGSGGISASDSDRGAQTAPSIEAGSAGAGASDAAGASSDAGGSVSDAGAGEAGALANGGAHTAAGAAGEAPAGGAIDGGAPETMSPSGGTHFCERAEDCSNALECRGRASSVLQVCLAGCAVDADCAVSHRCVMPSDPLGPDEPACFLRCDDSPLVCPYAFDCYDISGAREYTCLPRQW